MRQIIFYVNRYTYVNFEGLVKLALKLVNCLNFKAFMCMYEG